LEVVAVVAVLAAVAELVLHQVRGRRDPDPGPTADATPAPVDVPPTTTTEGPPGGGVPAGLGDAVTLDHDTNRVVRRDAAGNVVWATPLEGYLGLVRPPHLLTDAERAYVTHGDGVTALDARTGDVAWHSAGAADRMLLTGRLLVATQCGISGAISKSGRWVLARDTTTGAEVFRVAIPVKDFDAEPIVEVTGLVLVQKVASPTRSGLALFIDREGKVRHRFDRRVVTAQVSTGGDRLVLTGRDVVRVSAADEVRWVAPIKNPEWLAGGGLVPLPGGDLVAFVYGRIADSGVQVMRLDQDTGRRLWEVDCAPLRVAHSGYNHVAVLEPVGDRLRVTSKGSYGTFVEVLDARDGRQLNREVRKPSPP
jgi:outer membrane protein assembly factor BamB